jgi:hypothetical protein
MRTAHIHAGTRLELPPSEMVWLRGMRDHCCPSVVVASAAQHSEFAAMARAGSSQRRCFSRARCAAGGAFRRHQRRRRRAAGGAQRCHLPQLAQLPPAAAPVRARPRRRESSAAPAAHRRRTGSGRARAPLAPLCQKCPSTACANDSLSAHGLQIGCLLTARLGLGLGMGPACCRVTSAPAQRGGGARRPAARACASRSPAASRVTAWCGCRSCQEATGA